MGALGLLQRAIGSALALALELASARARAAISAEIPAECGSAAAFESELRRRLPESAPLDTVRLSLAPEASGYRLLVAVGEKRREIHDQNCQELLRAAIVVTVALVAPEESAPLPPPSSLPPPREPKRPAPAASPRFELAAGAGVHFGTLPQITPLLELDAQVGGSRYGVAAGLRYLAPAAGRDPTNHGVEVSAFGSYLAGTYTPWSRLQTRAGVVVYRLSGSGLGSLERSHDTAWDAGAIVSARFTPFALPPFWSSVGAEGQLNALRARFEILDYGQVFRVPLVSGTAFVQAGVVW